MPEYQSAVSGMQWPAIPTPVGASLLALLYQLEQTQWWPSERLLEHQLKQLSPLLRHAYETVPYYRDHYGNLWNTLGTEPVNAEWFQSLPILTRSDLQTESERLQSKAPPKDHGALLSYATSGSLGTPLAGTETEVTHFIWNALNLREQQWQRRDLQAKFAAIRTNADEAKLPNWGDPVSRVFATGPAATLNIATSSAGQVDWLQRERPDYLLTHPSNLQGLAHELLAATSTLELRGVGTFGEALPQGLRTLCRQAFNAPLSDIYSAEEVGYIALQCPDNEHYHVMAENLIVEILDDAGDPCRRGEIGRVVVTTLHNFAMPLIRYEIGDYAVAEVEPCACGRGLPVLSRIEGRRRNMLLHADGSRHWPSFPGDLWLVEAAIRQIQLVQEATGNIVVRYVRGSVLSDQSAKQLADALANSLPFGGDIRFERVDELRRGPGGKFEDFICRVN